MVDLFTIRFFSSYSLDSHFFFEFQAVEVLRVRCCIFSCFQLFRAGKHLFLFPKKASSQ